MLQMGLESPVLFPPPPLDPSSTSWAFLGPVSPGGEVGTWKDLAGAAAEVFGMGGAPKGKEGSWPLLCPQP